MSADGPDPCDAVLWLMMVARDLGAAKAHRAKVDERLRQYELRMDDSGARVHWDSVAIAGIVSEHRRLIDDAECAAHEVRTLRLRHEGARQEVVRQLDVVAYLQIKASEIRLTGGEYVRA